MKARVKFILAFLCFPLATSKECKYKKFSKDHSFCKEANKNCDLMKSEVTDDDKKLTVKKHNEYRSKIATGNESRAGGMPEASNMLEMVWDDELASIAQKWANQCDFKHDCNDCRRVERFRVGQNLYIISSTGEAVTKDWENMVKNFYEEVKDFNKNNIKPFKSGNGYGHFTQLVWATSWRVGCGEAVYKEGGQNKSMYVCNYGPGGNINGGEMYKEGKPCSACPSGTCCGNECKKHKVTSNYEGLCKVLDEDKFKIDEDNSKMQEQNSKMHEHNSKMHEHNSKMHEHNSKMHEHNSKMHEHNSKMHEHNSKMHEHNSKMHEDNFKIDEDNFKIDEDNFKIDEDNFKIDEDNFKIDEDNFKIYEYSDE